MEDEINNKKTGKQPKFDFLSKIKIGWSKFITSIKRLFLSRKKDTHAFRKKLVWGIIFGILSVIIVLIIVFGIGLYKYNWKGKPAQFAQKIIPYPAAVVAPNIIFLKDYNIRLNSLDHYYNKMKQTPPQDYKKEILENLIDQKIIEKGAQKYKIQVTDEEFNASYQELILGEGSEENLSKLLNELWGFNLDYFKDLMKDKLLEEKLRQEIPYSAHISHILFLVPAGADANKLNEISSKANNLKNEILAGRKFDEAATKLSEDTTSKDKGGDLGWVFKTQIEEKLSKDCADKIFNLRVGEFDVCQSQNGYNIVTVSDKRGKVDKSFDDWFSEIKEKTLIWRFVAK